MNADAFVLTDSGPHETWAGPSPSSVSHVPRPGLFTPVPYSCSCHALPSSQAQQERWSRASGRRSSLSALFLGFPFGPLAWTGSEVLVPPLWLHFGHYAWVPPEDQEGEFTERLAHNPPIRGRGSPTEFSSSKLHSYHHSAASGPRCMGMEKRKSRLLHSK